MKHIIIYENYSNDELNKIDRDFFKKLYELYKVFEEANKDVEKLYVINSFSNSISVCIDNVEYTLFKSGTEFDLNLNLFRRDWIFIGYQTNCETQLFDELEMLENLIRNELKKYIKLDWDENHGINFKKSEIIKLQDVEFDTEQLKIQIEANKYNM